MHCNRKLRIQPRTPHILAYTGDAVVTPLPSGELAALSSCNRHYLRARPRGDTSVRALVASDYLCDIAG